LREFLSQPSAPVRDDASGPLSTGEPSLWQIRMGQAVHRLAFKAYRKPPTNFGIMMQYEPSPDPIRPSGHHPHTQRRPQSIAIATNHDQTVLVRYSPGFFDRQGGHQSSHSDAVMRYLDLEGSLAEDTARLHRVDLLRVESLSKRSPVSRGTAWLFDLGADRATSWNPRNDGVSPLRPRLRLARGLAFGTPETLAYALPGVRLQLDDGARAVLLAGLSARSGPWQITLDGEARLRGSSGTLRTRHQLTAAYQHTESMRFELGLQPGFPAPFMRMRIDF